MHLLDLFGSHPVLKRAVDELRPGARVVVSGAPSASWGALAAFMQRARQSTLLLVAPHTDAAESLLNDLRALYETESADCPDVLIFPVPGISGAEDAGDARAAQERLAVLDALHDKGKSDTFKPCLVVATVAALSHPTLPAAQLRHGYDEIVQGQTLDRASFIEQLASTGFERMEEVEAPSQFAVRGGLIDFFPPAGSPIRLELFGDEVDSLREFDVDTQRSTTKIKAVRLTPPREVYFTPAQGEKIAAYLEGLLQERVQALMVAGDEEAAEDLAAAVAKDTHRLREGVYFSGLDRYRTLLYPAQPTLLEHLPEGALVVWCDPERCRTTSERLLEDDQITRELQVEAGSALPIEGATLVAFGELWKRAEPFTRAEYVIGASEGARDADLHLPPAFAGKLEPFTDFVAQVQRRNGMVVISTLHARRVREILADGKIGNVHLLDALDEPAPSVVLLMNRRLTKGFATADFSGDADLARQMGQLVVLTDAELFGYKQFQPLLGNKRLKGRARKVTQRTGEKSTALTDIADLKNGDFVVHINHGVARYGGVVRQEIAGAVNDYLLLAYEGSDRLYVPVQQLDRIQKYLGNAATPPPLNSLKGDAWQRTKARVKEETVKAAKQLAELYAAREQSEKDAVGGDTPWQREMEAAFPYEETPTQLQAIKDTKGDLETTKPMDRLVCGDVGFGKTEVAVRAAFKVVQDSKQVALLVPTTVLAQQHYQTFAERLAPYPTRVEVLSRFRTPGEQRKIIEDVKMGAVDIIIGTHKLLRDSMEFRDLGLVIVDEEQRFGVMQKERLKELRTEVDILTLSATPIPRTLQMALGGLREISLITDPPAGRLPTKTFVMPHKDEVVRAAIERELERDGQVYYVHNRVSSIMHIAEKLRKLVPHARIGVGHGQMNEDELEQVMLDFMHRKTDVLLSTTIVENGLDLPNANTLIVDRSELLGLSQMYQLRGRVGRSMRQGYAYFFSGSRGRLGQTAEDRFSAIQEYTDLGSGFKIAMRDLEIRGAGDLLGLKQSGSIANVGFEMYVDMLNEAVAKLQRKPIFKREELPEADVPVPAFLPNEYVPQERERLQMYRKMSAITNLDEAKAIQDELRDRFGPLPPPAFNLIRVLKIRVHLLQGKLRGISKSDSEVLIRLKPGDRFRDEDMQAMFTALNGQHDKRVLKNLQLRPMEGIVLDTRTLAPTQMLRIVEQACEALGAIRGARFLAGDFGVKESRVRR